MSKGSTWERIFYVLLGAGATLGLEWFYNSIETTLAFWQFSLFLWAAFVVVGALLFGRD